MTDLVRKVVRSSQQGRYTVRIVEERSPRVFGAANLELAVIAVDQSIAYEERWSTLPDKTLPLNTERLFYKGLGWCVATNARSGE